MMARKKAKPPTSRGALRVVQVKLEPSVLTQLDQLVGIANAADSGMGRWHRADLLEFAVWKLHQAIRGDVEAFKRLLKRSARLDPDTDAGVLDLDVLDNALKEAQEEEGKAKGK